MRKFKLPKLYSFGLRYPWIVLGLALLLSVVSAAFAKNLKLQPDFSGILPAHTEAVANYKELQQAFGSLDYFYVAVESQDPQKTAAFAAQFAAGLQALPDIQFVEHQWPVDYFSKRKWFYLEETDLSEMARRVGRSLELEKEGLNSNFSRLMPFADEEDRPDLSFKDIREKYEKKFGNLILRQSHEKENEPALLVLKARPAYGPKNIDTNRALLGKVRQLEDRIRASGDYGDIRVGYTGAYQKSIEAFELFRGNIILISTTVFLLLLLILILYFRSFSGAILVGIPLALGILWCGGLIYLVLGRLNVVTGFAVAILGGLGSDYGIYLLSRYLKEREDGKSFNESCDRTFSRTGRATWMAMLTTAATFGALMLSDFDVFYEFGIVGGLGLVINYIAMVAILPALLEVGKRFQNHSWAGLLGWNPKRFSTGRKTDWVRRIFTIRGAPVVVAAAVLAIVLSGFILQDQRKIYFEDGLIDPPGIPSNQLYQRIADKTGASLSPTAILVQGKDNEQKVLAHFSRDLAEIPPEALVFNKVVGVSSFIPERQEEKRVILETIAEQYQKHQFLNKEQKEKFTKDIQNALDQPLVTRADLPEEVRRLFVSPNAEDTYLIALYPSIRLGDSDNMMRYRDYIFSVRESLGVAFKPVDGAFVGAAIIDIINSERGHAFGLLLIFMALVLFLQLRDVQGTLLILAHILGSLVVMCGVLHLAGIKFNVLNMAVLPILLGTADDCFIHLFQRYDEEGEIETALREEVPPILVSNLTTIVGFGGFIFTSAWGLQSIGWVSVIGLVIVTLFCTFVFPRTLALTLAIRKKILPGRREELAEL